MVTPTSFGTGTGGFAPTNFFDSLYPYAALPANTALQLALNQYSNQTDYGIAQMSAQAQAQAAAQSAAAQMAAAQIAAAGGLAQQNVQSGTQASIANTNAMATLIAAAGGDKNAIAKLNAQNALAASLANQGMEQQILGSLASTGLRDQLQARAWSRGFAPQPGFGGAMNNWLGGVQKVQAPVAQYQEYDWSKFMPATATTASMPQINIPSFGGGGGFSGGGGGGAGNIGELFGNIYSGVNSALGPLNLTYGGENIATNPGGSTPSGAWTPPASALTGSITGNPVQSAANTQAAWEQILANPSAYMNRGGRLRPGQSAIVGDAPGGRLTPFSEVVTAKKGGVEVTPIRGAYATGTSPVYNSSGQLIDPAHVGIPGPRVDQYGNPDGIRVDHLGNPGGVAPAPTAPTPTVWNPSVQPVASGSIMAPSSKTTAAMQAAGVGRFGSTPQAPPPGLTGQDPVEPPPEPAPAPAPAAVATPTGGQPSATNFNYGGGTGLTTGQELLQTPAGAAIFGGSLGAPYALPAIPQTTQGVPSPPPLLNRDGQYVQPASGGTAPAPQPQPILPPPQNTPTNPYAYNANQTFSLPEYGLYNGLGPAQLANLFRPGIMNAQEQQDVFDLLGIGGYSPLVAADIIARFTPGAGQQRAIGF